MFQENDRKIINKKVIFDFLEDCAEIGVKGISFVDWDGIVMLFFRCKTMPGEEWCTESAPARADGRSAGMAGRPTQSATSGETQRAMLIIEKQMHS